jgi:hypothetical protein
VKPLTVVCVFVRGEFPYTPEYVVRLEQMARRFIARPFRFVCLTDQPETLPTIETIAIEKLPECWALWSKLHIFDQARFWSGRVLYLDLDVLLVAPLDDIIDAPSSFALIADAGGKTQHEPERDRCGRRLIRKFNSSVMVFDAGKQTTLFDDWDWTRAARWSTDQDWIALRVPHAHGLPIEWFPRISLVRPPWPADAKVVLCKKPKNLQAVEQWPELRAWWGA